MKVKNDGWGTRAQLEGTVNELKDLQGNQDGIWNNETEAPSTTGNFFERNALASKAREFLEVGIFRCDEERELSNFVSKQETSWGQPTTNIPDHKLKNPSLFRAQKAIALKKMGRTPAEVTEGFISASGKVMGREIPSRELFWQRFEPTTEPSGKMVLISPGYQETGRNFYEQIAKLNAEGHDVIVMDHQWSGHSEGNPGEVDSGFGVARDVAAMASFANQVLEQEYEEHPSKELLLYGNSMGAGPGVLGALTLNEQDLIELDSAPMPKGLQAVLQAPFLGGTPNLINKAIGQAAKVPFLNSLPLTPVGVPVLTHDHTGGQKAAQHAILENTKARMDAFATPQEDLQILREMLQQGQGPAGNISIVIGDDDPVADADIVEKLTEWLPSEQLSLTVLDSKNHVLQETPSEQNYALGLIKKAFSFD